MYTCEKCGCNYDAGEMRGGVCIDCREKQQERAGRMEEYRRMIRLPPCQLMFDMEGVPAIKTKASKRR